MLKYSFNKDFFKEETEKAFYWAGFIAADGCVRIKKSKYSQLPTLEIVSADHEHLIKFMSDIDTVKPVYRSVYGYSKIDNRKLYRSHISLHSENILNDLDNKFNIRPKKTHNHDFPLNIKEHFMLRHFLRGYFDGDGGFYLNTSGDTTQMTVRICGTIEFLTDFKECIEEGADIVSASKPYMYNGQGALNYCGNRMVSRIAHFLYDDSDVYLDRKLKQANQSFGLVKQDTPSKNQLIDLYGKHNKTKDVANALGITIGGVTYLVRKYNLQKELYA